MLPGRVVLTLCELQSTWPDHALLVEVQPLTPPKSRSGKLATIFKLTHYRGEERLDRAAELW